MLVAGLPHIVQAWVDVVCMVAGSAIEARFPRWYVLKGLTMGGEGEDAKGGGAG